MHSHWTNKVCCPPLTVTCRLRQTTVPKARLVHLATASILLRMCSGIGRETASTLARRNAHGEFLSPLGLPNCCVAYSAIPLIGAFTFSSPSIFLCSFSSKSACHVLPEAFPRAMKAAAQACSCSCACAVVLACRSLERGEKLRKALLEEGAKNGKTPSLEVSMRICC